MNWTCLVVLFASILKHSVVEANNDCNSAVITEVDVVNFIFRNYSPDARPVKNISQTVHVNVRLTLNAIKDFDEKQNTLILDGYYSLMWPDELLAWNNVYPYNCTSILLVSASRIWKPEVVAIGSNFPEMTYSNQVKLNSNGMCGFYPAGDITVGCDLDLTLFPFDSQICTILLEGWNYPITHQVFSLSELPFSTSTNFWQENRLWEIVDNRSSLSTKHYLNAAQYSQISYKIHLKRKPLFYFINIIIPSIIIALSELAVFVLPVDEVIKVHISFTCLLAYSVFEDMILADLPKSSDSFPLLSLYIDLQMAYIAVIALLGEGVVFVFIRKSQTSRKVKPPICLLAIFRVMGKVLCIDGGALFLSSQLHMPSQQSDALAISLPNALHALTSMATINGLGVVASEQAVVPELVMEDEPKQPKRKESNKNATDENSISAIWIYMAEVLERFNMLMYTATVLITPIIMFSVTPRQKTLDQLE